MTLARFGSLLATVGSLSVLSLSMLAGCGGRTVGNDLTQPTDPNDPRTPPTTPEEPPGCATIYQGCDPGDRDVGSEEACSGGAYCYSRTAYGCNGEPTSILWCRHEEPAQCAAFPSCDSGDKQVTVCPSKLGGGVTCYPRSLCGATIQCVHSDACKALPQCNAGDVEVTAIDTCSKADVSCYAVTECNFTIHCYTP